MKSLIPGYSIIREIITGPKHITYEGVREKDSYSIWIKTFAASHPPLEDVARLKNEYEILHNLPARSIVKALALEEYGNKYYLILENPQNQPLRILLNQPVDILSNLKIALSLVKTLDEIHSRDIIHKDINPDNILVDPVTLTVQLTGFTFASLIPHLSLTRKGPTTLEGTLYYISPEQTGRMNREIDYRTDFYSLGITLFELFTHRLPFEMQDPMELIHAHIAKSPPDPKQLAPFIPEQISRIILKLLSKKAEDRYQSCFSLSLDLERCITELETLGTIEIFPLGLSDITRKLQISKRLHGREPEIHRLNASFEEVTKGETEWVLLSGYAGIGKTSIVNEMHKQIIERKGTFISGKYDQYKMNVPYNGFISAFQDLIQQLLTESTENLEEWKKKIAHTMGNNITILSDLIPELSFLILEQPSIELIDTHGAQNRISFFFQKFISLFASADNPLVIFLDDLQWIDAASLQLIEQCLTVFKIEGLLLIGAYRSNEVTPLHPLASAIDKITKEGGAISVIEVPPLEEVHTHKLLSESLRLSPNETEQLSKEIFLKTHGNPFFIIQFLTYLYENNLLFVRKEEGAWRWDLTKIKELDVSDNVVDLLLKKLKKCSKETQAILQIASCLGNSFDIRWIVPISKKPFKYVMDGLLEAIREGLVLSNEEITQYMWIKPEVLEKSSLERPPPLFRFLHDKVQQACYQMMNEEQRKEIHYQIGSFLKEYYKAEQFQEHIFEIASHLNAATDIIYDEDERKNCAEINYLAGNKAMRTAAHRTASVFLSAATNFLPKNAWQKEYELTFKIHLLAAEASYLSYSYEDAFKLFDLILKYAQSTQDKVAVCKLKIKIYSGFLDYKEVNKWGELGLQYLGFKLPKKMLKLHVLIELLAVKLKLRGKNVMDLAKLPLMTDPNAKDLMHLISLLTPPIYFSNPDLFAYLMLKGLNMTLKYGTTPMVSYFYGSYGVMLLVLFEDLEAAAEFGQLALKVADQFDDKLSTAATKTIVSAFFNPSKNHIKTSVEMARAVFETSRSQGDIVHGVFALGHVLTFKYFLGEPIGQLSEELSEAFNYLGLLREKSRTNIFKGLQQSLFALQGKTNAPDSFETATFKEEIFFKTLVENKLSTTRYYNYSFKLILCYLSRNFKKAREYASQAEVLRFSAAGLPLTIENTFYHVLSLTADFENQDKNTKKLSLKKIPKLLKTLKKYAAASPFNYKHRYLLSFAEYSRVKGNKEEAFESYDSAIESAKENGYTQIEAIGNELLARFLFSENRDYLARKYLSEAYYAFYKWGAQTKVQALLNEFGSILTHVTHPIQSTTSREGLEFSGIFEIMRKISSEMVPSYLYKTLIEIGLDISHADRALLIVEEDGICVLAADGVSHEIIELPGISVRERKQKLSTSVINTVLRTKKEALYDSVSQGNFSDVYLEKTRPHTIFAFPLLHQSKLIAILYLENFYSSLSIKNLEYLKLQSTQMAIAVEHALLYKNQEKISLELQHANEQLADYSSNLEKKVENRTQELDKKHEELESRFLQIEKMQKKLVQQEKIVSLNEMTKEVVSAMREPLSYIYNFSSLSQKFIEEFSETAGDDRSRSKASEINNILHMLYAESRRADDIITTLRQYSLDDEAEKVPLDINGLLQKFVFELLEAYKKRTSSYSPQIEMHLDPNLPSIAILKDKLNLTLFILLDMAFHAQSFKKEDCTIIISTKSEGKYISIQIKHQDSFKIPGIDIDKHVDDTLLLCEEFTERDLKGHLTFASNEGWSILTLTLPIS